MDYEFIRTAPDLRGFLDSIQGASCLAFDTEFVSEDRFRPQLCLIQIACQGRLAVVDPLAIEETTPFWNLISTPGRVVIAHAAREEVRFCQRFTGKPIAGLFDLQLAAGFVGLEYPLSLGNLVSRILGKSLDKGETRTNWRNRPLHQSQLEYALNDVVDLERIHAVIAPRLGQLGRESWFHEEMIRLQESVGELESAERWRKVSGCSGLGPRQLEIVRQLWLWRERRGRQLDEPTRRILRDDLMIELARRQTASMDRIREIRGMERRELANQYREISQAIEKGLSTPDADLPRRPHSSRQAVAPMLSQFLSTAVACICRQHGISPGIVGNSDDVRELIAFELATSGIAESSRRRPTATRTEQTPALLRGWRGEVVGRSFQDLLSGRLAIRIADHTADQPLEFCAVAEATSEVRPENVPDQPPGLSGY